MSNYILPIEEVLRSQFIRAITGGHICSDVESDPLALSVKFGGLDLQKNFSNSRSSLLEVFCKKDVLRNFAKFIGKHLS